MPNRIIRESCRTSPNLALLSHGAERLFWRLITVADDFGRFEADADVLLCACFPKLLNRVKRTHIKAWFGELVTCQLVTTYVVKARIYAFFNTWDHHQRTRAQHSKYPAPSSDNICQHMLSNVADLRESRIDLRESNNTSVSDETAATASNGHGPEWGTPEALIALYNTDTPDECPAVTKPTDARIKKAKLYLRQFPDKEFWQVVCQRIHQSSFLRGLKGTPGHEHFKASFDWLLTKGKDQTENVVKVFEGRYSDG